MQDHLCFKKGTNFNVYDTFKVAFKELIKTNSLLILHANLYFLRATNYVITPLKDGINHDDHCGHCSSGCKWEFGTRVIPGLVYTKFISIDRTENADEAFEAFEAFEAKRIALKLADQNSRPFYDFPFQTEAELEQRRASA